MRNIRYIVLHCTATQPTATVKSIQQYWKNVLHWKNPGYHFIIQDDGAIINLLPIEQISNGVAGYNSNSIHISYIGGVDPLGHAKDTRTANQIHSQITLLKKLKVLYPDAEIKGHRDFPNVHKECPSFDVKTWLRTVSLS